VNIVTDVGVLDKAMAVLAAVEQRPMHLAEIQTATRLPRATAHRLATSLERHGMLRRDDAGRFDLGPHAITLGTAATARFDVVRAARPVLEDLRAATGESVQLFVREGDARRCTISLESPHGLRWIVPEGALLPLDVGSSGRVLGGEVGPRGWVESVGEREPGVASVSAPVRGSDGVVTAVSVSGPIDRLTRRPGRRFGSAVVEAAARLGAAAFGVGAGA
jgi:DNA-binding IclR family transcriptional regulator